MSTPNLGGHGKAASFSGDNGMRRQGGEDMGRAKAFGNMGAHTGGVYSIPAPARAGAFECDESCRGYTGNPRDSSGPVGNTGDANNVPRAGLTRQTAK